MRLALDEIPPFSMRVVTLGLGARRAYARTHDLRDARSRTGSWKNRAHLVVSSILNVLSFSLLSVIAMMFAGTGRVAMLAYTMPIWAALFAWVVLGERLTRRAHRRADAVHRRHGDPDLAARANDERSSACMIALCIAVSWAAGTVYVKWARMTGDPVANAAWQVVIAFVIVVLCCRFFEGTLHLSQAHEPALVRRDLRRADGLGARLFPVVRDHRPRVGDDGVARRAERAGDRRGLDRAAARRDSDARRTSSAMC